MPYRTKNNNDEKQANVSFYYQSTMPKNWVTENWGLENKSCFSKRCGSCHCSGWSGSDRQEFREREPWLFAREGRNFFENCSVVYRHFFLQLQLDIDIEINKNGNYVFVAQYYHDSQKPAAVDFYLRTYLNTQRGRLLLNRCTYV